MYVPCDTIIIVKRTFLLRKVRFFMKTIPFECYGEKYELHFKQERYKSNDNLGIRLIDSDGSSYAMLTKNFNKLPDGDAFVDTNMMPGIDEILVEKGIAVRDKNLQHGKE